MPGRNRAPSSIAPNPMPPAAPAPGDAAYSAARAPTPSVCSSTFAKCARAASRAVTSSGEAPFCGP
ncbi:hypothetical protein STENM36S_04324 [Streptomyces tendae]